MNVGELFDLSGDVALVTGGGTGLGRQMALALAEAGADVVIGARRLEMCEQTAALVRKLGRQALAVQMDITQAAEVNDAVNQIVGEFSRLDILVNNAGTFDFGPVENESLEEWHRVQRVNLTGSFVCAQVVGRQMICQGGGRIIQISSIYGQAGMDGALYTKDPNHLPARIW